jgi:hypothetical protein
MNAQGFLVRSCGIIGREMDTTPGPEHRLEPRSNIFVIATLYGADGSAPVRIRNMSRNGALVEGGVLPPVGAEVRLCRGALGVTGHLIWLAGRRAGLQFASSIATAEWLPNGNRGSHQQLADEMAHQARMGTISLANAPVAPPAAPLASALNDELLRVCRSLERAGEDLASDAEIAAHHSGPLQLIDMAARALAKLAATHGSAAVSPLRSSAAP